MNWLKSNWLGLLIGFALGFGPFLAHVRGEAFSRGYDAGREAGEKNFVETFCSVDELRNVRPSICE